MATDRTKSNNWLFGQSSSDHEYLQKSGYPILVQYQNESEWE